MGANACCHKEEGNEIDIKVQTVKPAVESPPPDLPSPPTTVPAEEPKKVSSTPESAQRAPPPAPVLEVELLDLDPARRSLKTITVNFTQRPLGMKFACKNGGSNIDPVFISYVTPGGQAEALGIKQTCLITKIAGTSTTDIPFDRVSEIFEQQVELLPDKTSL